MKTIIKLSIQSILIALLVCSCTKEYLPDDLRCPSEPKPYLKKIEIEDPESLATLKIEIHNEDYGHLTCNNFKLIAEQTEIPTFQTNDLGNRDSPIGSHESTLYCPDIIINDIDMPSSFNAFTLEFIPPNKTALALPLSNRLVIDFDGSCKVAEENLWGRVTGFKGRPKDCNRTQWAWSYKQQCKYYRLYKQISNSNYTKIQYNNPSLHSDIYQLLIETNNDCSFAPSRSLFTMIYSLSSNPNCN